MKLHCNILTILAILIFTTAGSAQDIHSPNQKLTDDQPLQLIINTDQPAYKLNQPIHMELTVRNAGNLPIIVFNPDSIHQINSNWNLQCQIKKPEGQEVVLQPDIMFQNISMQSRENFMTVDSGDEILFGVDIVDHMYQNKDSSPWIAIIDTWSRQVDVLKGNDFYARKIKGVRGDYFTISGKEVSLAVRDLLKDVFNQIGKYSIVCEYSNNVSSYLLPKDDKFMDLKEFPECWTGKLISEGRIEIVQ